MKMKMKMKIRSTAFDEQNLKWKTIDILGVMVLVLLLCFYASVMVLDIIFLLN